MLTDPWGAGYRYAISDVASGGNRVLVTANGIRNAGMANVTPNLFLCTDNTVLSFDLDCGDTTGGADVLGTNGEVAAVIISLGRDREIPATSNIQAENIDDFNDGTDDRVYIYAPRSDDYDDIVRWLPTNLLFSRMIPAEQLP